MSKAEEDDPQIARLKNLHHRFVALRLEEMGLQLELQDQIDKCEDYMVVGDLIDLQDSSEDRDKKYVAALDRIGELTAKGERFLEIFRKHEEMDEA